MKKTLRLHKSASQGKGKGARTAFGAPQVFLGTAVSNCAVNPGLCWKPVPISLIKTPYFTNKPVFIHYFCSEGISAPDGWIPPSPRSAGPKPAGPGMQSEAGFTQPWRVSPSCSSSIPCGISWRGRHRGGRSGPRSGEAGMGPTSRQGGYSQVFAVTQLLLSRVCRHIFVSRDWERPGSSGLGMPRRGETSPKLPGCRDVFPPVIHSPLPEVKESRVPPAQSSGRQNRDLAGLGKSRSWEVWAEVLIPAWLAAGIQQVPSPPQQGARGRRWERDEGLGGHPHTPLYDPALCLRSPSPVPARAGRTPGGDRWPRAVPGLSTQRNLLQLQLLEQGREGGSLCRGTWESPRPAGSRLEAGTHSSFCKIQNLISSYFTSFCLFLGAALGRSSSRCWWEPVGTRQPQAVAPARTAHGRLCGLLGPRDNSTFGDTMGTPRPCPVSPAWHISQRFQAGVHVPGEAEGVGGCPGDAKD